MTDNKDLTENRIPYGLLDPGVRKRVGTAVFRLEQKRT